MANKMAVGPVQFFTPGTVPATAEPTSRPASTNPSVRRLMLRYSTFVSDNSGTCRVCSLRSRPYKAA
jgi:hypothetical protein